MPNAQTVNPLPGPGWRASGAFDFPSMWAAIEKHKPPNFVASTSIFMAIYFEETACSNMEQQGKPIAIGPGQFQISEDIGIRFFADTKNGMGAQYDSSLTLYGVKKDPNNDKNLLVFKRTRPVHPELSPLSTSRILDDNDFSVKMHVKLFRWMAMGYSNGQPKGLQGLLSAQTGNDHKAADGFRSAASAIDQLMLPDPKMKLNMSASEQATYVKKRRSEWIWNLNIARRAFRGNPIKDDDYQNYWQFFLPDGFILSPTGYMASAN